MGPGSIVARTKEIDPEERELLNKLGNRFPPMNEPLMVIEGPIFCPLPYFGNWFMGIMLEGYEKERPFNIDYFSELLPPGEVCVNELLKEPQLVEA